MKAFVTGSTGLLGSNLVRLLLAQGHEVKALARSAQKAELVLGDTSAEIIIGDMQDVAAFAPAMAGCDVLYHCAAYFREYYNAGDHWPLLQKINVDGVIDILTAAEKQGIQKAVHVSSAGVIGMRGNLSGDESTPPSAIAEQNLYFKSKILAEEAVQQFISTHDLPVFLILPSWMMGPGDTAPTDSGQIILDLLHGEMPAILEGGSSIVDVRDVTQAMLNVVEYGRNGERYIIGGTAHTLTDIATIVAELTAVAVPRRIPYPLALAVAWASETMARLRNTETVMTVNGVRTVNAFMTVDSAKAQRELEITFRSLTDTIADEIRWFIAHDYVKTALKLPAMTSPTL